MSLIKTELIIHGAFFTGFVAGCFLLYGFHEIFRRLDFENRLFGAVCILFALVLLYCSPCLFHVLRGGDGLFSYRINWLHVLMGTVAGSVSCSMMFGKSKWFMKIFGAALLFLIPLLFEEFWVLFLLNV